MPPWTPEEGIVSCKSCGATFPPETFPEDQFDRLMDRHDRQSLLHEMGLLSRTKALFEAHSEARQVIESIQRRAMDAILSGGEDESDAGERRFAEGRQLERWTEDDPELRDFLKGTTFLLEPRMAFIEESLVGIQQRIEGPAPACPRCGEDTLEWVEPQEDRGGKRGLDAGRRPGATGVFRGGHQSRRSLVRQLA